MTDVARSITTTYRDEWGSIVAALMRRFGDLDLAEEATAEAFAIAVERWPTTGVPPNPGGWLNVTATRKAIGDLSLERALQHTLHEPGEEPAFAGERVRHHLRRPPLLRPYDPQQQ